MQEKNVTMEDAFQVWWFIFWRTFLTAIVIAIVLGLLAKIIGSASLGPIFNAITLIASIIVQVFYIRMALNRNFKKFRLSALENEQKQYGEQPIQQ